MPSFLASTASKLIAGAVILAIVVIGVLWLRGSGTAQLKQDVRSADAQTETARDVIETVLDNADESATVNDIVAETVKGIDNEADRKVTGAATVRAVCQLPEYRNDPAC